jgi:hypothetical protein
VGLSDTLGLSQVSVSYRIGRESEGKLIIEVVGLGVYLVLPSSLEYFVVGYLWALADEPKRSRLLADYSIF